LTAALLHGEALEPGLAMQKRSRPGLGVVFTCFCLSTTTTTWSQNSTSPRHISPNHVIGHHHAPTILMTKVR
jgi:hypothetical protein